MSKKNILIFTGAGFGSDANLPVEKYIMKNGVKICEQKKPEVLSGLEKILKKINPSISYKSYEYAFEKLFSKIVLEEEQIEFSQISYDEVLSAKLAVLEILAQSLKKPLETGIPRIYTDFVKLYKDEAHFVTINYDYLIETILLNENILWNYGAIFSDTQFDHSFRQLYIRGENRDFSSVFHYLKLHGSFNWHYCWQCGNTRVTDLKYFGISGEVFSRVDRFTQACTACMGKDGQAVMQPLIIPPSSIKYYNTPIFHYLWFQFQKLISRIEKLIIIGCSVRDEDTLLLYSLFNLHRKNQNLSEIIVVNPDESVGNKIRDLTNIECKIYKSLNEFILHHN